MTRWIALVLLTLPLSGQAPKPSPHAVRFVTADDGVRLEVLDWGGSGRPLVLLAGGGNTAHVFDDFAPKLASAAHVYGITRRGFGASGFSAAHFGPDRLGDDVLQVMDALHLARPVLAGHSLGGEELSSVATRHPDRVAGLVYLDAAYPYAFDNGEGPSMQDFQSLDGPQPPPPGPADIASVHALYRYFARINGFPFPEDELRATSVSDPDGRMTSRRDSPAAPLLLTGLKKYASLPGPVLAIFANPHSPGSWVDRTSDPAVREAAQKYSAALSALVGKQIDAFRHGVPAARVVVIPNAHHYVYLSNTEQVLDEMRAFLKRAQ